MAATASPTPIPVSEGAGYGGLYRRPSAHAISRSALTKSRRTSPVVAAHSLESKPSSLQKNRATSAGDSSDDELPAPIKPKLSASVKALLGQEASSITSSPAKSNEVYEAGPSRQREGDGSGHRLSASRAAARPASRTSPLTADGSPAPRVVRVGPAARPPLSEMERDGSFYYKNIGKTAEGVRDSRTPATRIRTVRVNRSRSQTRSPSSATTAKSLSSSGPRSGSSENAKVAGEELADRNEENVEEPNSRVGPSTVLRQRSGDEMGAHSTMRIKRVGKTVGSYLNGPVRRGMIRRPSEDEELPLVENSRLSGGSPRHSSEIDRRDFAGSNPSSARRTSREERGPSRSPREERQEEGIAAPSHHVSFASSATVVDPEKGQVEHERILPERSSVHKAKATPVSSASNQSSRSSSSRAPSSFKMPPLPPLPSRHDQENEPPPTFKRNKPAVSSILGEVKKVAVLADKPMEKENHQQHPVAATNSPRKPLAAISTNTTPHRAAPLAPVPQPPPKFSVSEAATATAGAAATSTQAARKKKQQIPVNGKFFTRLDRIARGGSSQVYRVMAENFKIFALKRVNLESADPLSIAGFKGEIDLLRRLENVDRVVRLFDYEVNDAKQMLSVLMELGETDLSRILNQKIKNDPDSARFDVNWTRYYWKEMLECVAAVHAHEVVHSDLKPANFVVVQGRLKLIDFGIANAINEDTVNVYRESNMGTPNYMAPESLIEQNAAAGKPASAGRVWKVGKPSDVWGLGCILYQMVYGAPPFAHLNSNMAKLHAITNPKFEIAFPSTGVGGVAVPRNLIVTLKKCLQRDQRLRPTVEAFLADGDAFLASDLGENVVGVTRETLGAVIGNVVKHCRRYGVPEREEEVRGWAPRFFEELRKGEEESWWAGGGR
ncbi:MAG: hypothetical protein Q9160_004543 [Pyrenula sp. 1 TL-2023]